MIPEKMYQAMLDESRKIGVFGHGFTYSGHPVAAAVALKTLEIYTRDRILDHVNAVTPGFWHRLNKLKDHPLVGEVRGKGLVAGLELVANKATKASFAPAQTIGARAAAAAQSEGILLRNLGDTLALCPPLIIHAAEIDELFDKLERALDQLQVALAREEKAA